MHSGYTGRDNMRMISFSLAGGRFQYSSQVSFLVLAVFFLCLFMVLSAWQAKRALVKAEQVRELLADLSLRPLEYSKIQDSAQKPLSDSSREVLRQLQITGRYLPYTLLLDNSVLVPRSPDLRERETCHWLMTCGEPAGPGRVGYRVMTLFLDEIANTLFVVERGWMAGGEERSVLPQVARPPTGTVTLVGIPVGERGSRHVLRAESLVLTQNLLTGSLPGEVVRVQNMDFSALQDALARTGVSRSLYPAVFILHPSAAGSLPVRSPLTSLNYLTPQRHWGYAFQWLLMALVLAGFYLVATIRKQNESEKTKSAY